MISVVHDYSVLYSNRILQKDKRWADGRLRYYEFNNKMEVFSEEQFLLASDFYPSNKKLPIQSGAFEEGSEFKLPSGKFLISVQEYLGCSERDVSKVFKKADRTPDTTNSNLVKAEPLIKTEKLSEVPEIPLPDHLSFLKTEPKESITPTPKPRRIGLTRKKGNNKKQSDLSLFTRGPSVSEKLRKYLEGRLVKVTRIPPRSANLYTRLNREISMEVEDLDRSIKFPHTGLTQRREED